MHPSPGKLFNLLKIAYHKRLTNRLDNFLHKSSMIVNNAQNIRSTIHIPSLNPKREANIQQSIIYQSHVARWDSDATFSRY